MAPLNVIPKLHELPLQPDHPPHSSWGLWKDNPELGSLNWLSDETVCDAAAGIRTGQRITLKYEELSIELRAQG